MYEFQKDELEGPLSFARILKLVSQEEIFSLVFGFIPVEGEVYTSPFRRDRVPNCWFRYRGEKLWFIDFANPRIQSGIKMSHIDCFSAVLLYFKLPDIRTTLEFIYQKLIKGKEIRVLPFVEKERVEKKEFNLVYYPRDFNRGDQLFWGQFEITTEQLNSDFVYPVSSYTALNTKKGDFFVLCERATYAYSDFPSGKVKLYTPHPIGKGKKFITTCTSDDIGGLTTLAPFGKMLVITKSYKDWRVLKNNGFHTVWFQSETQIPKDELLFMLAKRFREIMVWYDNDEAGISGSRILTDYINSFFPRKAFQYYIEDPSIKDPAQYISTNSVKFKNQIKNLQ